MKMSEQLVLKAEWWLAKALDLKADELWYATISAVDYIAFRYGPMSERSVLWFKLAAHNIHGENDSYLCLLEAELCKDEESEYEKSLVNLF